MQLFLVSIFPDSLLPIFLLPWNIITNVCNCKNFTRKSHLKWQIKLTHLITRNFVIDTNYVNQLVCIAHVLRAGHNHIIRWIVMMRSNTRISMKQLICISMQHEPIHVREHIYHRHYHLNLFQPNSLIATICIRPGVAYAFKTYLRRIYSRANLLPVRDAQLSNGVIQIFFFSFFFFHFYCFSNERISWSLLFTSDWFNFDSNSIAAKIPRWIY